MAPVLRLKCFVIIGVSHNAVQDPSNSIRGQTELLMQRELGRFQNDVKQSSMKMQVCPLGVRDWVQRCACSGHVHGVPHRHDVLHSVQSCAMHRLPLKHDDHTRSARWTVHRRVHYGGVPCRDMCRWQVTGTERGR